jgi:cell division septum initiation protein DivIVA
MNAVQNLKIYEIIEQFEDLIENSPKPKLSGGSTKRIVDIEEIYDLLGDLKTTIPEDIRRANGIVAEKRNLIDGAEDHARDLVQEAEGQASAMLADAKAKAEQLLQKAKGEYERLIAEDEIYLEAQRRAQLLALKAEYSANEVYENAKIYADEILADLERFLGEYKRLVEVNRRDLDARTPRPAALAQPAPQPDPAPPAPSETKRPPMRAPVQEDALDDEY